MEILCAKSALRHPYFILLIVALSAILRVAGYPPIRSSAEHSCAQATVSSETERTFSESDFVSDFALSGGVYSVANSAYSRQYKTYSQVNHNDYSHSRTTYMALSAAQETAASHRLNYDISCAEALVVGLPTEDISFPFNSFW